MGPVDQPLDGIGRPGDQGLDRPVGAVRDPATDTQPARLVQRGLPEEHSLHLPTDAYPQRHLSHPTSVDPAQ